MKYIILLTILVFAACSSSQFTLYKPSEDEPAWRISVEKDAWEKFVCSIDDSAVVEESFSFLRSNFEKDGSYGGKNIKMSGFRITNSNTDSDGNVSFTNTYQIRIFIDEEEVGYFAF